MSYKDFQSEVNEIALRREHNEMPIVRSSPKFGEGNFSRAITIQGSTFRVDASKLMAEYSEPSHISPTGAVVEWNSGSIQTKCARGQFSDSSEKAKETILMIGKPENFISCVYKSFDRPGVVVGLKFGSRRAQAKHDLNLSKHQVTFVFPPKNVAESYEKMVSAGLLLQKSVVGVAHLSEIFLDPSTSNKGFGGATKLVSSGGLSVVAGTPSGSVMNFVPLVFQLDLRNLLLLPQYLMVQVGSEVTARSYDAVRLSFSEWSSQVDTVPPGAEFLGYVWRFMNRDGGPDRRYNDNYQIPVIRTWEIDFHIDDVGEIHTAFSSREAVHAFVEAFNRFQRIIVA
ncbi:MAG: hypothetical protein F2805_00750 [Actinobacteria bacterium]|nr:hypothetical protein [Actinomycetota bacterium]